MAIDEAAVLRSLAALPFVGNEEGLIPAFGMYLTRQYADYFNRVSFGYLFAAEKRGAQERDRAREMLVDAGHACAFFTFGGMMLSQEWEAIVAPMLERREDWVHGVVAMVNNMGWGRWRIEALSPGRELRLRIDHSYEASGYVALRGPRKSGGVCFLATGGIAGLMNLLYVVDIAQRPELTPELYERVCRAPNRFVATEPLCSSTGAGHCELVARRA